MAFCVYCGKPVQEGVVCSCQMQNQRPTQQPINNIPEHTAPPAPNYGTQPQTPNYSQPTGAQSYAQPNAAPTQGYASAPQSYAQPSYDPTQYQPQIGQMPNMPNTSVPTNGGYPVYGVQPTYAVPAQPSQFMLSLKALLERVKMLFSANSRTAVTDAINDNGLSWSVVFGAFVVLSMLSGTFGLLRGLYEIVSRFSFGMLDNFSEYIVYAFKGGMGITFLLTFLLNFFMAAALVGVVMGACAICKKPMSFFGALNLVSLSLIPAVGFSAISLLFSFCFPVGALLSALLSAVVTVVIICCGVSAHTEKSSGVWIPSFIAAASITAYTLLFYIIMSGVIDLV